MPQNIKLERAALEMTYDGYMTVTGYHKTIVDGETVAAQVLLHENQPCALSFNKTPDVKQGEDSGEIQYQATIFCAPELDIPAGCQITVQQYGKTYAFRHGGECACYPTHQQLSVMRERRA